MGSSQHTEFEKALPFAHLRDALENCRLDVGRAPPELVAAVDQQTVAVRERLSSVGLDPDCLEVCEAFALGLISAQGLNEQAIAVLVAAALGDKADG